MSGARNTDRRRWVHSPDVVQRRCLDAVVALAIESANEPARLEGTALAAWELLAEPSTLDDLAVLAGLRYELDADVVRDDLARLLDALVERGLVTAVE